MISQITPVFYHLLLILISFLNPNFKKPTSADAKELEMDNLGGVFFVLMVGSLFATFVGFIEWIAIIYKRARQFKVSLNFYKLLHYIIFNQCKCIFVPNNNLYPTSTFNILISE